MKTYKRLSFLIFLFLMLQSCGDDDSMEPNNEEACAAITDLGAFEMLETSKEFAPYPTSVGNLILSDANGNEYSGEIIDLQPITEFIELEEGVPCPIDTSIAIKYTWEAESKSTQIIFGSLDIRLEIVSTISIDNTVNYRLRRIADMANLFLYSPINLDEPSAQMVLTINSRDHSQPPEFYSSFLDEFEIHGVTFQNVYQVLPSVDQPFELLYSEELGFIGFKSNEPGADYFKFERLE